MRNGKFGEVIKFSNANYSIKPILQPKDSDLFWFTLDVNHSIAHWRGFRDQRLLRKSTQNYNWKSIWQLPQLMKNKKNLQKLKPN